MGAWVRRTLGEMALGGPKVTPDGDREEEGENGKRGRDEEEVEETEERVGLAGKKSRERFAINKSYSIEVQCNNTYSIQKNVCTCIYSYTKNNLKMERQLSSLLARMVTRARRGAWLRTPSSRPVCTRRTRRPGCRLSGRRAKVGQACQVCRQCAHSELHRQTKQFTTQ